MINLLKNIVLFNIVFPVIPISLLKHVLISKLSELRQSIEVFLQKPEGQQHSRNDELELISAKLSDCISITKNLGKGDTSLPGNNTGETASPKNQSGIPVTVVVPVYNVAQYLKVCLDSIVAQSLKNIEIICINDGSTDDSLSIIHSYAKDDDRLIVIDQSNKGLSATRNVGLQLAKGEYVFFMDSDDMLELNALEFMYNEASKLALDVIYCDGASFYESKQLEEKFPLYKTMYVRPREFSEVTNGLTLFRKLVRNKSFTSQVCLHLCKREYLLRNNLFFPEGILFEDIDFSLRCILQASRVSHRKKAFFKRRVRESSIMTSAGKNSSRQFIDYFTSYSYMPEFLKGKKLNRRSRVAILVHLLTYIVFVRQHFETMKQHNFLTGKNIDTVCLQ